MQLILISGLSGSGKSVALKVLEDGGYFCVDNLPVSFLAPVSTYLLSAGYQRLAIAVDVRGGPNLANTPTELDSLRREGIDVRVLFLEAKTETIVKRFSETRRKHPLSSDSHTVLEAIELEREMLAPIGEIAHRIDTSELNANALRNWVKDIVNLDYSQLTLIVESFGFKHGIPLDADFVFDVRCLPNPYYDLELRPFTGKDEPIVRFLEAQSDVTDMYLDIERFVSRWLPCFIQDNRSYLTVAIGCTGGQHRSVYIAERLALHFGSARQVLIRHREQQGWHTAHPPISV